jgi:small subunit ribosomal protein S4
MRQMRRYFKEALRQPGNTAEYLLQLLERRLDNVIYCLRFALSRAHARQLITHGHIRVNQVRVRSPSYWVQAGDVLTPGPKDRSKKMISESIRTASRDVPSWLKLREDPPQGTVLQLPTKQDLRVPFNPQLIVEYMSR